MLAELDRIRTSGVTASELKSAQTQLRARLVFDNDSVTNIAHQLGYYETIAIADVFLQAGPSIEAVTLEQVAAVAVRMLGADNRTVGWFDPLPVTAGEGAAELKSRGFPAPHTGRPGAGSFVPQPSTACLAGSASRQRCRLRRQRNPQDAGRDHQPGHACRIDLRSGDRPRGDISPVAGNRSRHRPSSAADIAEELDHRGISLTISSIGI
jgi:hypothetical protein